MTDNQSNSIHSPDQPKVGVAVIVCRDGKVLLGKRRNAHGEGTWAFPGGHLEFNESIEACARREVREETGLEIADVRYGTFTNDVFKPEHKHYVTLFVVADGLPGAAEVREPEKCEVWEWFDWGQFPEPRFLPIQNLLDQGFSPFRKETEE